MVRCSRYFRTEQQVGSLLIARRGISFSAALSKWVGRRALPNLQVTELSHWGLGVPFPGAGEK